MSIRTARQTLESQFPSADLEGGWNDAGGIPVEVIGIGFFDFPHGQVGRAPNNLEIHPILSISFPSQVPVAFKPAASAHAPAGTAHPTPAKTTTAGGQWDYTMVSAATAELLLSSANKLGKEGWEMVGFALDTNRRNGYVGYLKRPRK